MVDGTATALSNLSTEDYGSGRVRTRSGARRQQACLRSGEGCRHRTDPARLQSGDTEASAGTHSFTLVPGHGLDARSIRCES